MDIKSRTKKFYEDHPRTAHTAVGLATGVVIGLSFIPSVKRGMKPVRGDLTFDADGVKQYLYITFRNGKSGRFLFTPDPK